MTDRQEGAVLQFEIDIDRWTKTTSFNKAGFDEKPWDRIYAIAKTAAADTITNGGTLVIVRDGNRLTIVQRPDAEPLDATLPPAEGGKG